MARRRLSPASLIAGLAAATAMALPGMAMADSYMHPAPNEAGVTIHPSHFKSDTTRAQVIAQAEQAVREGGSARLRHGAYPPPAAQTDAGKTRQEVINELLRETPAQRQARERGLGA